MFRQANSLMIIQRYSSRLDRRSKHEAINLGASARLGTATTFAPLPERMRPVMTRRCIHFQGMSDLHAIL
jgi:hypothetical protein